MSSAHGEQSEILSTSAAQSVRLVALSSTNTRRNGQVDALARGINRSLSQRERERAVVRMSLCLVPLRTKLANGGTRSRGVISI